MFHRVFLRDGCVVALPRPGTKTAGAVPFELGSGRKIEIARLPPKGADGHFERAERKAEAERMACVFGV